MNLRLREIIDSRVYLLVRVRVACTTTPCISWNWKNFCISYESASYKRLVAVISQTSIYMKICRRLRWWKICSVKSEKRTRKILLFCLILHLRVTICGNMCKTEECEFLIIWDKCIACTLEHLKTHITNHFHWAIFNFTKLFFILLVIIKVIAWVKKTYFGLLPLTSENEEFSIYCCRTTTVSMIDIINILKFYIVIDFSIKGYNHRFIFWLESTQ